MLTREMLQNNEFIQIQKKDKQTKYVCIFINKSATNRKTLEKE